MEVHAHSHLASGETHTSDPDSRKGRKKWTHYFREFLMLFLAVFCGFLAEYQLEHKIEKDREHQYMETMLEDLKTDAAMFEKNIGERISRIVMIDSLVKLLGSPYQQLKENDIYFFARNISPPANIFPNDRTIQQLKSSGNLRLIRNKNISNEIMAYDQLVRQTLFELDDEIEIRAEYRQLASKVFNTTVFHEMIAKDTIARPTGDPVVHNES